jgi:hypothetical protein
VTVENSFIELKIMRSESLEMFWALITELGGQIDGPQVEAPQLEKYGVGALGKRDKRSE